MRGGRNKFGPMYKRDRARKLQLLRQRQLAAQQARSQGLIVSDVVPLTYGSGNSGYLNQGIASIKQEIQIPQVSSLTSSPDSSPSPLASLGMVNGGGGGGNGPGGQGGNISLPDPSKLWGATSSTSPNSSSNNQKSNQFAYDSSSNNQGGNNGGQGGMGGNGSQSGGSSSQVKIIRNLYHFSPFTLYTNFFLLKSTFISFSFLFLISNFFSTYLELSV